MKRRMGEETSGYRKEGEVRCKGWIMDRLSRRGGRSIGMRCRQNEK